MGPDGPEEQYVLFGKQEENSAHTPNDPEEKLPTTPSLQRKRLAGRFADLLAREDKIRLAYAS